VTAVIGIHGSSGVPDELADAEETDVVAGGRALLLGELDADAGGPEPDAAGAAAKWPGGGTAISLKLGAGYYGNEK
jgi:hypothetical protein